MSEQASPIVLQFPFTKILDVGYGYQRPHRSQSASRIRLLQMTLFTLANRVVFLQLRPHPRTQGPSPESLFNVKPAKERNPLIIRCLFAGTWVLPTHSPCPSLFRTLTTRHEGAFVSLLPAASAETGEIELLPRKALPSRRYGLGPLSLLGMTSHPPSVLSSSSLPLLTDRSVSAFIERNVTADLSIARRVASGTPRPANRRRRLQNKQRKQPSVSIFMLAETPVSALLGHPIRRDCTISSL
ncbi:hypothetical protein B0T25DRAFT_169264 [Lasiosphaeria hispida]|uniref:Uncharacterized protein n=1 Tax=Lasiosphaeria hispida TaxID=260671 RepID=A0AAJ0MGJ1_9PEZI|nr:hypothetical protein B0T25DRAFT_169264 [Lasiosphaeria hispida]